MRIVTVSSSPETSSRKRTNFCLSSIQNEYYTHYVLLCGHCIHNLEYFFFLMKSTVVFLLLHKQNCLKNIIVNVWSLFSIVVCS